MEQNFQPQQPAPPLTPTPLNNKNPLIIIVGSILITALVVGLGVYFLTKNKTPKMKFLTSETSQTTNTPPVNTNNKIYFGKGGEGKYSLVDVQSGETKSFIPAGYTIVDQHEYETFSTYLILQKDNDLVTYNLENNLLNSVFGSFSDLKLKKNEQAHIYPSITEKGKFFLVINEYNPNEEPGMGGQTALNTRSYTFDASTNKLVSTSNVSSEGCEEYDSKNQRFFTWPCGEGIGYSTPLSISNMTGNKQREIITQEEFGLTKDNIGPVAVKYQNGFFLAQSKGAITKVVVVDPQLANPTKETYLVSDGVKSQIKEAYPYSTTIAKDNNTIIIGGNSYILLLRFDSNKQIMQSAYIPDKEIYANFIFSHGGKLYYQAGDNIRVVNLDSWRVEKSIPSKQSEEITLFSLPN